MPSEHHELSREGLIVAFSQTDFAEALTGGIAARATGLVPSYSVVSAAVSNSDPGDRLIGEGHVIDIKAVPQAPQA